MATPLWKLGQVILLCMLQARFADTSEDQIPGEALPTRSGYLDVNTATASRLFYAYYEALEATDALSKTPVLLWLQVPIYFFPVCLVQH